MSIFPVRESCTVTDFGADATAHAANMPATVNAGDLLLALVAFDNSITSITTPSGWSVFYTHQGASLIVAIYGLVATGSEGGTTVDFVTNNTQRGSIHVYRMSSWAGNLNGVMIANGMGSTGSQIALMVSTRVRDIHWIVAQAKSSNSAWGAGPPTNYSNNTKSGVGEDVTASASIASATRTSAAGSELVTSLWSEVTAFECILIAVLPRGGLDVPRASSRIGI